MLMRLIEETTSGFKRWRMMSYILVSESESETGEMPLGGGNAKYRRGSIFDLTRKKLVISW